MKCKNIWAVEVSLGIRNQVKPKIVLESITITNCPKCSSLHIKKDGIRHNKSGDLQKYECLDWGKWFSTNIGFKKMKHNPQVITTSIQLYFSGESLRNTQKSHRLLGVEVSYITISNWIEKYLNLIK